MYLNRMYNNDGITIERIELLPRGKQLQEHSSNGLGVSCTLTNSHYPTQELVDDIRDTPTHRIGLFRHVSYCLCA